ncbi:MAG: HAD-IIA family hydrolase [Kineosporiaceae bacterium]
MTSAGAIAGAALPWQERAAGAAASALLLDLDGVVIEGRRLVPGADAALVRARRAGVPVRFVTNNASRSPAEVAAHLTALGVPATAEEVVTSAVVAVDLVSERANARHARPRGRAAAGVVAVVGSSGLLEPLADAGLTAAAAVDVAPGEAFALVQGFSPDIGWRDLAAAARHVRAGTWWIATNLDPTLPTEDGPAPGNGSLVGTVRTAAGRGPDAVAGKPDAVMIRRALPPGARDRPAAALVVGDRLDTDVAAALAAGATAALVLTGVHGVVDLLAAPPDGRPHLLAASLASVTDEHPAVRLVAAGVGACRGARVTVAEVGDAVDVTVAGEGERAMAGSDGALDTVRALCTATWSLADDLPDAARARLLDAIARHPAVVPLLGCGRAPSGARGG